MSVTNSSRCRRGERGEVLGATAGCDSPDSSAIVRATHIDCSRTRPVALPRATPCAPRAAYSATYPEVAQTVAPGTLLGATNGSGAAGDTH